MSVAHRMRIAEFFGEVRQHRGDDARIGRRRRLIVEIDWQLRQIAAGCPRLVHERLALLYAAVSEPAAPRRWREARAPQAARKPSTSSRVVRQPRLTRMALAAWT